MQEPVHKFMYILFKETELKYKVDEHEENINFVCKTDKEEVRKRNPNSGIKKT